MAGRLQCQDDKMWDIASSVAVNIKQDYGISTEYLLIRKVGVSAYSKYEQM